jgi:hypothetical protein
MSDFGISSKNSSYGLDEPGRGSVAYNGKLKGGRPGNMAPKRELVFQIEDDDE